MHPFEWPRRQRRWRLIRIGEGIDQKQDDAGIGAEETEQQQIAPHWREGIIGERDEDDAGECREPEDTVDRVRDIAFPLGPALRDVVQPLQHLAAQALLALVGRDQVQHVLIGAIPVHPSLW
ncbi:hypothetical protein D9M72_602020 [compost metagenome]